jgi:hypothetical protein
MGFSSAAVCPNFLKIAIEKMIAPHPPDRYTSFDEAVAAIASRNVDVEVARDSFARILSTSKDETRVFFFKFYKALGKKPGLSEVFRKAGLPDLKSAPPMKWK